MRFILPSSDPSPHLILIQYGVNISRNVEASKRVSPLFHMDKLCQPVLLLHGEDDPRVPIKQTDDLVEKLKVNGGKNCLDGSEYVRFAKEGHGIRKEQNVLYMYHRVEKFLCQHLDLPDPPELEKLWVAGHTATDIAISALSLRASTQHHKEE